MKTLSGLKIYCSVILLLAFGCKPKKGNTWRTYLKGLESYSSIRTVDLNNDGVLDVVMGAGRRENYSSDSAVIALDGLDGELLWHIAGRNRHVGSAAFLDVTNDGIKDVFIGGRWAELKAIDGAKGVIIWEFLHDRKDPTAWDLGWFNFSTPQLIPDQDGDGIEDILISNGGDARVAAGNINRPAGRLMIFSSRNGKILSEAFAPDGKEIYTSLVCFDIDADGELDIFFGTGGETAPGSLYRTTLSELKKGDISGAQVLATSKTKGFVAPPLIVELNNDNVYDIVTNTADGRTLAIDGAKNSLIWETSIPGGEAYNTPSVGYFTDDSIPDFFTNFGIGTFPNYSKQVQILIDGKNGQILHKDSLGEFQYTTAIVADLTGDGKDDILMNIQLKNPILDYYSYLLLYDYTNNQKIGIGDSLVGMSYGSTPWMGDLNADGYLEILYSSSQYRMTNQPLGVVLTKYQSHIKLNKDVTWGAYMGNDYTNVLKK